MNKYILTTFLLSAAALVLHAQDDIRLTDFALRPGDTQHAMLTLATDVTNYAGFQADIVLPEGISVSSMENVGRIIDESNVNKTVGTAKARTVEGVEMVAQTVLMATTSTFRSGEGALADLILRADASIVAGTYKGYVQNIILAFSGGMTTTAAGTEFIIEVYDGNLRVTLDETATAMPKASDGYADVRVLRTIPANEWSTIVLPFGMDEEQVAAAFGDDVLLADFTGYEATEDEEGGIVGITVKAKVVKAIEANRPCLIRVAEALTEFTVDGVVIAPEEEPTVATVKRTRKQWSELIGTYVAGRQVPTEALYLSDGKFVYSDGNAVLQGYRAYFDLYDVLEDLSQSDAVQLVLEDDGVATQVSTLHVIDATPGGVTHYGYDLSGRRILSQPRRKGVYVVDGKKLLVK